MSRDAHDWEKEPLGGATFKPAISVEYSLERLQKMRLTLVNKRDKDNAKINAKIKDLTVKIQELCDHEWYWAQVAGEGRICSKCGKVDYEGD